MSQITISFDPDDKRSAALLRSIAAIVGGDIINVTATVDRETVNIAVDKTADVKAEKTSKAEKQKTAEKETEQVTKTQAGQENPNLGGVAAVTLDMIREKAAQLIQGGKRDAVKKIADSFGVAKITAIPEDAYADVWAQLNNL